MNLENVAGCAPARAKCPNRTWKRCLEITGDLFFLLLRNIHSLDVVLANLKTNCSEAWALPISVVFTVAVYAALAVIFYNADD